MCPLPKILVWKKAEQADPVCWSISDQRTILFFQAFVSIFSASDDNDDDDNNDGDEDSLISEPTSKTKKMGFDWIGSHDKINNSWEDVRKKHQSKKNIQPNQKIQKARWVEIGFTSMDQRSVRKIGYIVSG